LNDADNQRRKVKNYCKDTLCRVSWCGGLERFLAAKLSVDEARSRFIEFTSERKKIRIEIDGVTF
jgi:hypothetical protein